tara:strand:+ start:159 stop:917 length:759 start_codon:yes stop_codon:yes gene_type:complete
MNRFIGGDGKFHWFHAEVVNINDPKKLGLFQIRIDGFHEHVIDEELPWATPIMPVTSASYQTPEYGEVGTSPTGILVGSFVLGFFMDGVLSNTPVILGTMAAIKNNDENSHDVPKLAREINTWESKELLGPEPQSTYSSKYPFNTVTRSLSGHTFEIDDTPNAERIHIYHKSGTYIEISADGRTVTKIAGDNYTIIAKDNEIHVQGNVNINVKGNVNIQIDGNLDTKINGNCKIESIGDMTLIGNTINLNPK